jgi:hypothetical protein
MCEIHHGGYATLGKLSKLVKMKRSDRSRAFLLVALSRAEPFSQKNHLLMMESSVHNVHSSGKAKHD